eukprot:278744-Prorocentrum_minimum.AAC.1
MAWSGYIPTTKEQPHSVRRASPALDTHAHAYSSSLNTAPLLEDDSAADSPAYHINTDRPMARGQGEYLRYVIYGGKQSHEVVEELANRASRRGMYTSADSGVDGSAVKPTPLVKDIARALSIACAQRLVRRESIPALS